MSEKISFAQFEEGNILNKTRNNEESDNYDSIMSPLLREEEIYAMDSWDESKHDLIYTDMLEDIRDGSQSFLYINQREARYKIRGCTTWRQNEWKGGLKATRNMGNGLH